MRNSVGHVLRRVMLAAANLITLFLPRTRAFPLKRLAYVLAGVELAPGVKVVSGTRFHFSNVAIGADTWVGTECHFFPTPLARISIGARVDVAPGCFFIVGSHEIGDAARRAGAGTSRPIIVGDGCWIGARSTMLGGTFIGSGCIVAAGAVVKGVFPDNVLIGGVPARIIKRL